MEDARIMRRLLCESRCPWSQEQYVFAIDACVAVLMKRAQHRQVASQRPWLGGAQMRGGMRNGLAVTFHSAAGTRHRIFMAFCQNAISLRR